MALSDQDLQKITHLFSSLSISEDKLSVTQDGDTIRIIVEIPAQDAGIYIGRFASTLDSIQLILSLFLRSDEIHHIYLDIGGYRERRQLVLEDMAARIEREVEESGEARAFPPLSSSERRQLHILYQDNEKFTTFSQGEGYSRRLFLEKKSQ